MSDDAALLQRYARDRAEDAFTELVKRHVDLVYCAALRQLGGDAHRAQDVTQLVFTLLARKAASFRGRHSLAGWLFVTTRFAANHVARAERRRHAREQEAHIMHELLSSSDAETDWNHLAPVIDEAMAELNERDREVVLLRFFSGRKLAEIGAVLRLSEDAARMRVDRALERLRAVLVKRGVTSTAGALALALSHQPAIAAPAGLALKAAGLSFAGAAAFHGTAGVGFFNMITASKILSGGACGVAILATILGVREMQHARESDASLTRERAELRAQLALSEKRAADLEAALQSAQASTVASASGGSTSTPAPVASSGQDVTLEAERLRQQQLAAARAREARAKAVATEISAKLPSIPLGGATHVAFVIDTSGSMRDPSTEALKLPVLLQFMKVLAENPTIQFVQVLDADGRFIMGSAYRWLPLDLATQAALEKGLFNYRVFSNSGFVPGITRAISGLALPESGGASMNVVVLGDEFTEREDDAIADVGYLNPTDANGRRRVSISAVGFSDGPLPAKAAETYNRFNSVMGKITAQHGGVFAAYPKRE